MRKGVIIGAHDHGGHFSVDRTINRIMEGFLVLQYVKVYTATYKYVFRVSHS